MTGIPTNFLNYNNPYGMQKIGRFEPFDYASNSIQTDKSKNVTNGECQTCRERRYVDGSNESNVSFKTPSYISPGASAAVVAAHEQEHVANAISKASEENAELVSASVRLKSAICPECGTAYVSGGVTETTIRYTEKNPYDMARKLVEGSLLAGRNIDYAA